MDSTATPDKNLLLQLTLIVPDIALAQRYYDCSVSGSAVEPCIATGRCFGGLSGSAVEPCIAVSRCFGSSMAQRLNHFLDGQVP